MSIADRLKNAYENVAYNGDNTWINESSFRYQKANLELYTREQQLGLLKFSQLRPRYVKECIPKSKLAQYDNYQYDEARELSYNANISRHFTPLRLSENFERDAATEPWMLPEIDDLYVWFLNCHYSDTRGPHERRVGQDGMSDGESFVYESPLIRARFFEENVLRFFVTSDRVKHLWDVNVVVKEFNDKSVTVYRSPMGIYYSPHETHCKERYDQLYNWLTYMLPEENSDLEIIKNLTHSLSHQRTSIAQREHEKEKEKERQKEREKEWAREREREKQLVREKETTEKRLPEVASAFRNESEPERRLYSAVLQGLSPKPSTSRNGNDQMTVLTRKSDDKKNLDVLESYPVSKKKCFNHMKMLPPLKALEEPSISNLDDCIEGASASTSKNLLLDNDGGESLSLFNSNFSKVSTAKTKVGEEVCSSSHYLNSHTFMSNTNFFQASASVTNPMITTSFGNTPPTSIQHTPSYVNNYSNYQFSHFSNSSFHQTNNCLYSNNTYCNVSQIVANRTLHSTYSRNYVPNSYPLYQPPFLMLQQNRSSTVYPQMNTSTFIHQTQQQTHFYKYPMSMPRTTQNVQNSNFVRYTFPIQRPATFSPSMPPHFVQPTNQPANWMVQNQQQNTQHFSDNQNGTQSSRAKLKTKKLVHPQVNVLQSKGKLRTQPGNSAAAADNGETTTSQRLPNGKFVDDSVTTRENEEKNTDEFEEVVSKTIGVVLDEPAEENFVPIQVSVSEVLELEALEQYSPSNDNVYQELERQAAEQYDEYSENWIGPPNCNLFGGVHCTEVHCITIFIP